jgi:hypothetical protein
MVSQGMAYRVLCSGFHKIAIKVSAGLHCCFEFGVLFQAYVAVDRIWFLVVTRNQIFLLVASWGLLIP